MKKDIRPDDVAKLQKKSDIDSLTWGYWVHEAISSRLNKGYTIKEAFEYLNLKD